MAKQYFSDCAVYLRLKGSKFDQQLLYFLGAKSSEAVIVERWARSCEAVDEEVERAVSEKERSRRPTWMPPW